MLNLALTSFQRLLLLAAAADRCKAMRAFDLPPSASEPVVQLRVMGDFSITSEDDNLDDQGEENEACWFHFMHNMCWLTRLVQAAFLTSKTAKRPRKPQQRAYRCAPRVRS